MENGYYMLIRYIIDVERLKKLDKWGLVSNDKIFKWTSKTEEELKAIKEDINNAKQDFKGVADFVLYNDGLRLLWTLEHNREKADELEESNLMKIFYDNKIIENNDLFVKAELNRNRIQWVAKFHSIISEINTERFKDHDEVIKIAKLNLKYAKDMKSASMIVKYNEELKEASDSERYKIYAKKCIDGRNNWVNKHILRMNSNYTDVQFAH